MSLSRPCAHPGCRRLVPVGRSHCARHQPAADAARLERGRRFDRTRQAEPWRAWYKTPAWRRMRTAQLAAQPLCEMCLAVGVTTAATICDHKRPHRGSWELFFDPENVQSTCKPCHDSAKQAEERTPRGGEIATGDAGGTGEGSHIFPRVEIIGGVARCRRG